jgi:energy-coupling factor transporter ATP-binding protein EcfA2
LGSAPVDAVYVAGFRGVREGGLEGLEQVTVLVGRNGAGKSTILEAFYLASACAAQQDAVRRVNKLDYIVSRRGGRGGCDDARSFLWYMGDTSRPIEVRLRVKGVEHRFLILNVPREVRPVRLVWGDGLLVDLETGRTSKSVEAIEARTAESITSVRGELAQAKRFLEGILLVDAPLSRRPDLVESYAWPRLLVRRLDKLVVEMVREEFEPEAEGLTYAPVNGGYYLMLETARTAVRVDDLGDGARAALLASMLVLAYRPTILLIEEPELHMHPAGLYTYMRFLMRLSREQGFQIIASTHSIELVRIVQTLSKELNIGLSVLYLERREGRLEARSFTGEDAELLERLGIDVRLLHKF